MILNTVPTYEAPHTLQQTTIPVLTKLYIILYCQTVFASVSANSPRTNAQCTSLWWFIFNLHTTERQLFVYDFEIYMED
jgi:hypothetical protein